MHTSWLRGNSCLCFSKYLATSSGSCWSRNRIGQTTAEPSAEGDGDVGSLPHISARMGSVKDGRLERLPRRLKRDVELCGVARGLPLPLPDAKGHPSLLGVPMAVKSLSTGDVTLLVCIFDGIVGGSAEGPLQIFTPASPARGRRLAAATSACLITTARLFRSTSSLCAK
jgi:hypothetical protein